MLKRCICFILTLFLCIPLFSSVVFSEGIDDHLVAHWDFEGETLAEKLADKATAGNVDDKLIEYYPDKDNGAVSPIKFENGSAYIPCDNAVSLAAENSADINSLDSYTLYSRLEMSGKATAWADVFVKSGLLRLYVLHNGDPGSGDYAIQLRQNGSASYQVTFPNTLAIKKNKLFYMAVSVNTVEEGKFTVTVHLSSDGRTWVSSDAVSFNGTVGTATVSTENSRMVLGKNNPTNDGKGMNFKLYDVRIYNKALNTSELSTIPQVSESESEVVQPEAPEVPEKLLASWSFDEVRGEEAKDSIGNQMATLTEASFDKGISGNGILLNAGKNGRIDFGERGITKLLEGKSSYALSMWILPCYYEGKQTMRLLTVGADESGKALLDIYWSKNNAIERKGVSVTVRSDYGEDGKTVNQTYTLPDSVIGNLNYASQDDSKTFGVWQLLTVNVDLQNGACQVYINKDKISDFTFSHSLSSFSAGEGKRAPDTIGWCEATPSYSAFNGFVDEFRVYGDTLSDAQIATYAEEYVDTNSPTADQRLVDALIARLGDAAVLYSGSSNVLLKGLTVKLDPNDYTKKPYFKRQEVYAPAVFAKEYFKTEVSEDENGYVNISVLCKEKGYGLYSSLSRHIAIILPEGVEGFDKLETVVGGYTNEQYLDRIGEFFNNPYQPEPLNNAEQSRTVVFKSTEEGKYVQSPSICNLDGVLYASCDIKSEYTLVFRSKDGGVTWEQIGNIDKMRCASLFAYDGKLYLLGLYINTATDSIGICSVRDMSAETLAWTVSTIHCDFIEKSSHCAPTPVLFANGRAYMAFEDNNIWDVEGGKLGTKKAFVISCDLNDNLLDGSKWICSNYVTITSDWFKEMTGATATAHHGVPTLEGNMVQAPDGTLYNILRLNCEPDHSKVVMLKVSADGKEISIPDENAIVNFPGGENKFSIYYDESTGYYMSLVNNNTAPYWQMQRNVLSLSVSKDLINWEIVETVLVDRTMLNFDVSMATHGFQYVDWCIDGDDIVFTVRENMGDTGFYHNGYEMTFYRLSNYKSFLPDVENVTTESEETEATDESPSEENSSAVWKKVLLFSSLGGVGASAIAAGSVIVIRKRKKTAKIKSSDTKE